MSDHGRPARRADGADQYWFEHDDYGDWFFVGDDDYWIKVKITPEKAREIAARLTGWAGPAAGTGPDPGVISEREAEQLREIERLKKELAARDQIAAEVIAHFEAAPLDPEPPAVTLTDLQVLALLAAAPVESIKEGYIMREERSHWLYFLHESIASGRPPQNSMMPTARRMLARVLQLPPAPHEGAALRMRVEWATVAGQDDAGTGPDPGAKENDER